MKFDGYAKTYLKKVGLLNKTTLLWEWLKKFLRGLFRNHPHIFSRVLIILQVIGFQILKNLENELKLKWFHFKNISFYIT
jgi:hypothetical protein